MKSKTVTLELDYKPELDKILIYIEGQNYGHIIMPRLPDNRHMMYKWCPISLHLAAERLVFRLKGTIEISRYMILLLIYHFVMGIICGYSMREIMSFIATTRWEYRASPHLRFNSKAEFVDFVNKMRKLGQSVRGVTVW